MNKMTMISHSISKLFHCPFSSGICTFYSSYKILGRSCNVDYNMISFLALKVAMAGLIVVCIGIPLTPDRNNRMGLTKDDHVAKFQLQTMIFSVTKRF